LSRCGLIQPPPCDPSSDQASWHDVSLSVWLDALDSSTPTGASVSLYFPSSISTFD
jgi:hypothetical protein